MELIVSKKELVKHFLDNYRTSKMPLFKGEKVYDFFNNVYIMSFYSFIDFDTPQGKPVWILASLIS